MQESRRDRGYKKRAWWDREGKYHFDYGHDDKSYGDCGDNQFNTGKESNKKKKKKNGRGSSSEEDGLAEFGL